jgi:hypothetical protein
MQYDHVSAYECRRAVWLACHIPVSDDNSYVLGTAERNLATGHKVRTDTAQTNFWRTEYSYELLQC